jgi:predicted lipid-binding transport protein (Tim44 family)
LSGFTAADAQNLKSVDQHEESSMKTWLVGVLMVAMAATFTPLTSEAKRLGGGKSQGMQRDMPARAAPDAPPARPATPAQGTPATPAAAPAAAGAAAPAAAKSSWMGPVAGLAAGLGIAALATSMGFGDELASFLTIALLALVAMVVIGFLVRRFAGGSARPAMALPQGGGMSPSGAGPYAGQPAPQAAALQRTAFEPAQGAAAATPAGGPIQIGSDLACATAPADGAAAGTAASTMTAGPFRASALPAGFDAEAFERVAKMIFIRLQAANDAGDLNDLRQFTTPEMFAAIRLDLQERGEHTQHTDVVAVNAQVLDVTDEAERQIVSVRFSGSLREEAGGTLTEFDEVWHLVKGTADGRSWAIAGIEQSH